MATNKSAFDYAGITATLGKEPLEAFVKSGTIYKSGLEDMTKTYMALVQSSVEKNTEALKSLLSCKTLSELTEAQTKIAQSSFDDFMSSFTKLSEMGVKLATEAFEPINDQLGKSMKKASESMAA